MSNIPQTHKPTQLHPRLQRLDSEMIVRGGKQFDDLAAKHDGRSYPVHVMRIHTFRYAASTSTQHPTKNIVLRAYAKTPSAAVNEVICQLRHNLKQSPEQVRAWFPKMAEVAQ